MNCPKCNGERIEASRSFQPIRDATQYRLTCLDCGVSWAQRRGWRRMPDSSAVDEWANVTFVERGRSHER
jgi:hypothetical protein